MARFTIRCALLFALALSFGACADGTPLESDAGPPQNNIPPPPPPDKPGTPPPGAPDPDQPQPDPGPDDPPPEQGEDPPPEGQADECMGIDYLGVCHGTLAVWCEEGQLYAFDCEEEGLGCDFIDEDIGYYCVPDRGPPDEQPPPDLPPQEDPPPDEQPPPDLPPDPAEEDPCPGVDWFGRCDGNVAVWCDDEEEILQFDCTWIGMVCQNLGFLGHRCVAPDQQQNPPPDGQIPGG